MAEFSRKSKSKHIIENIDTTKVSKQEVYNFYLRWRKQYAPKSNKLDVKKVKKAEIVRELYKLEALQHGTIQMQIVKNFESTFQKAAQKAPTAANIKTLERLQKQADKLLKAGKISKQQAAIFEQITEEAKARKKASSQQQPRTKRTNVHYKGRYAYDYIKKMVDDSLLDTEDFEDSKEIWYALMLIDNNSEDFDFFASHYAGTYKKGSRDYYLGDGGFEDFLNACVRFERYLTANNMPIPEKYTDDYWDALAAWLRSEGSAL